MTELPDGYTLRRPTFADAAAVAAVQVAADTAVIGESDACEADLIGDWHAPRFDLQRDAWLVQAPDGLVCAYGGVSDESPHRDLYADVAVHPDYQGRGLETLLFDLLEARAREHLAFLPAGEPVMLGASCPAADGARRTFLESRGYAKTREFRRMTIDVSAGCPQPQWPPGIAVRTFRRGLDEAAVHEADQAAFADHFRPATMSLPEWEEHVFSYPGLDLGLWFVAWDGDRVAGTALAGEQGDLGYVARARRPPAMARSRPGTSAVCCTPSPLCATGGTRTSCWAWTPQNPTGAFHLYESVGMHEVRTKEFFEKELRA